MTTRNVTFPLLAVQQQHSKHSGKHQRTYRQCRQTMQAKRHTHRQMQAASRNKAKCNKQNTRKKAQAQTQQKTQAQQEQEQATLFS